MSEEMLDAASKLLADALGHIVGEVIHKAGRNGGICAEDVAVMNPPVASCRLGAVTQPLQVQESLVIRMCERQLAVHIGAAGYRYAPVIEQPPGTEPHGAADGSPLGTQHPPSFFLQDIPDKPFLHAHTPSN